MTIYLFILILVLADITDLGVMTPRRGFVLERNTKRKDWSHFRAEFTSYPSSNKVTLILTNQLLTLDNLVALPSGRTVLGLVSVCQDGQESATNKLEFEIWRAEPPMPTITPTFLGGEPIAEHRMPVKRIVYPPLPFTPTNRQATLRDSEPPPPLPNSKNETYAQHLDKIADDKMTDFYTRHRTRRRNE